MTQKELTKSKRAEKITYAIKRYNFRLSTGRYSEESAMRQAVNEAYYVRIRSMMPNQMDAYVAEIIDVAKEMALPESESFCKTIEKLGKYIKAKKIIWIDRKTAQTKLYEIEMSKAEYDAVIKFLENMRAE